MSILSECKKWEGQVLDGQFPLQKWLGGSEHSVVFLTERSGTNPSKAVIKLISAEGFSSAGFDEEGQLSRWRESAQLSHPNLIHLFESGSVTIANQRLLYVVMEQAEEDLGQILPLRPLSTEEVAGMLPPTAEALALLHQRGFVHGRMKPSNVMAVNDQLKISADTVVKSVYDAPEIASVGLSAAADAWSLGTMLLAVLTQGMPEAPQLINGKDEAAIPDTVPEPFHRIAKECLRVDRQQRPTMENILGVLNPPPVATVLSASETKATPEHLQEVPVRSSLMRPLIIFGLIIAALIGGFLFSRRSATRTQVLPQQSAISSTQAIPGAPAVQSATPNEMSAAAATGNLPGKVLHPVAADVSPGAQSTVKGHVKVSVQVFVDASGNVSQATLTSAGPSKYFASKALAAARMWKFDPPKLDGQPTPSEWSLRFEFGRNSKQVFPNQIKP